MEDLIRTVKVKLDVPDERCDDLHQTKDQFLHCANTTAEWAWRHPNEHCVTSKRKAENALYEQLRTETELTANLVEKGIRRGIEATKSGVARLKKGDNTSQLLKRLHSGQKSSSGGVPCQCALTSGTLNLNGEYTASIKATAEGESTDKPTTSVVGS